VSRRRSFAKSAKWRDDLLGPNLALGLFLDLLSDKRAIQYFAYPDWKFDRLRKEYSDGRYESGTDIADDVLGWAEDAARRCCQENCGWRLRSRPHGVRGKRQLITAAWSWWTLFGDGLRCGRAGS
jgi:hypothetical protein